MRRSVGDFVASTRATTLEDVVETEPVADLVGGGCTLVERSSGAAWKRVCQVDAAVEGLVGGRWARTREVAPVRKG